jgi:apolipoprotein N-acyltransferase
MSEAPAVDAPEEARAPLLLTFIRTSAPSLTQVGLTSLSAVLLALSFPNFDLWWLAWIGLTPLLYAVANTSRIRSAFVLGLIWGTIFFYGTCWWLTYPMIHYGGVSAWLAYPLLALPIILVAVFPALACSCIALVVKRFGSAAILTAPVIWIAFDWLRYEVTGQLWNSLGYSQAFHPLCIQTASRGGVHAVTFLLLGTNAAAIMFILNRWRLAILSLFTLVVATAALSYGSHSHPSLKPTAPVEAVLAIQPNVPMDLSENSAAMKELLNRHLLLTNTAVQELQTARPSLSVPRLVIWPESPMNFAYSRDSQLQSAIANFARANHTAVLLNSLEQSADGGSSNSAILVNELGEKVARYDKIRLMPFGEYVPLPRWLPGSGSVRGIVGEFTPGNSYTLMPLGAVRAGVFICIEAAHPAVAREFTNEGADVLINISNDGYLGPTAVMRQHLANAIFRAVENDRDLVRVTNSGISAYISSNGTVSDATPSFQEAVRTWTISKSGGGSTFYSRHGDVFAYACALITLGFISATFMRRRRRQ